MKFTKKDPKNTYEPYVCGMYLVKRTRTRRFTLFLVDKVISRHTTSKAAFRAAERHAQSLKGVSA